MANLVLFFFLAFIISILFFIFKIKKEVKSTENELKKSSFIVFHNNSLDVNYKVYQRQINIIVKKLSYLIGVLFIVLCFISGIKLIIQEKF